MERKQKIKTLLNRLDRLEGKSTAAKFANSLIDEVKKTVTQEVNTGPFPQLLEKLATDYEGFKKYANIDGIVKSIQEAEDRNTASFTEYALTMEQRIKEVMSQIAALEERGGNTLADTTQEIYITLNGYREDFSKRFEQYARESASLKDLINRMGAELSSVKDKYAPVSVLKDLGTKADKVDIEELKKALDTLSKDTLQRIGAVQGRGGAINRQIAVGGNTSVLSKYNDINLKPGANVTLTYTNNNATKAVDLTIAATGGSGTTRSVNSISTSQTAGDTASTDYVYVCSSGVNLTLPTAAGNTNLYTVKNTSNSSVLVSTTGGETIDADTNAILAVKYTSIDVISDGANWNIT